MKFALEKYKKESFLTLYMVIVRLTYYYCSLNFPNKNIISAYPIVDRNKLNRNENGLDRGNCRLSLRRAEYRMAPANLDWIGYKYAR